MIGIVGMGMVGTAVAHAFDNKVAYVDPASSDLTLAQLCKKVSLIFVCVPTDDGDNFNTLKTVLDELVTLDYAGIVIVKSTVLPGVLEPYAQSLSLVYNPEFLSRATAISDMMNPQLLVLGGNSGLCTVIRDVYAYHTAIQPQHGTIITDLSTASMIKYVMNTFYATKVTFMNQMFDVAQQVGADWPTIKEACLKHPWMGSNHLDVPGPDGQRGFGGPCLPKDTKAMAVAFDVALLDTVLELNKQYRGQNDCDNQRSGEVDPRSVREEDRAAE